MEGQTVVRHHIWARLTNVPSALLCMTLFSPVLVLGGKLTKEELVSSPDLA